MGQILNKKSDYYYTTGIDDLSVDGGVLTRPERTIGNQLRGEDIIFLHESTAQYSSVFNGARFLGRD